MVSQHGSRDFTAIRGPGRVEIQLRVNGLTHRLFVEPRRRLLDVLRVDLGLTGTKKVCSQGQCGACTVLLDGAAVYSCLVLAIECEGREITTIEGLERGAQLDPLQEAFVAHDALQCGFCTSGQVMAATALLSENHHPTLEEVRLGLSGNLCRCGAYAHIFRAVLSVSRREGNPGQRAASHSGGRQRKSSSSKPTRRA